MYRYRKERLSIVFNFLQNLRHFQDEKKEKINLYDNNGKDYRMNGNKNVFSSTNNKKIRYKE